MKQENTVHSQDKLTEIVSKEKQTLGLLDKDFKSPILNAFKELKENRRMMYEQIDSISRERNSKMESEILELKNNRIEKLTRAFS